MKITEITIKLEASEAEKEMNRGDRTLFRDENKKWSCLEGGGLFPHEVRLINTLQEYVIAKFNSEAKE